MKIDPLDKNLAGEQVKVLTYHLAHGHLFAPDNLRDLPVLVKRLKALFSEKETVLFGIYDEDANMQGVFGLSGIIKGHDATFHLWLWGKVLTPGLIKNIRNFLTYMKDLYGLKRVTTVTADDRHLDLLGLIGFKVEGRFRAGFKWDGKFYQLYQLRVIGEV